MLLGWFFGIQVARLRLGFLPPSTMVFFVVGWIPLVLVATIARRLRNPRLQRALIATLVSIALIAPAVATATVPAISQLRTAPIPGLPTLVVSASPHGNADLYLLQNGGQQIQRLTTSPEAELMPDLSRDGRRVVYVSDASGTRDLYVMDLDAQGRPIAQTAITHDDTWEDEPHWSPDGTRIVFTVRTGSGSDIAIVDADGHHRVYLTNDHTSFNPSWSPDGSSIAFRRPAPLPPADDDIWIMRDDGSHARDVIQVPGPQWGPSWSPDGSSIAFSATPAGDVDVLIANIDGTGLSNLTAGSRDRDEAFGWTPDGHVLFLSDRSHTGGTFLYFMDIDGSHVQLSVIL